jgi:hypothetical protein
MAQVLRDFRGTSCFHLQSKRICQEKFCPLAYSSTLEMEAAHSSKFSTYETAQCPISEAAAAAIHGHHCTKLTIQYAYNYSSSHQTQN